MLNNSKAHHVNPLLKWALKWSNTCQTQGTELRLTQESPFLHSLSYVRVAKMPQSMVAPTSLRLDNNPWALNIGISPSSLTENVEQCWDQSSLTARLTMLRNYQMNVTWTPYIFISIVKNMKKYWRQCSPPYCLMAVMMNTEQKPLHAELFSDWTCEQQWKQPSLYNKSSEHNCRSSIKLMNSDTCVLLCNTCHSTF